MRRSDLLKTLRRSARANGVEFTLVREGGKHSIYRYDGQLLTVPRHVEINEITARAVLKDAGIG